MQQMEEVVEGSAQANRAQIVGWEDGTSLVPLRDWQNFLKPVFNPLPGIKKYHHFRFIFILLVEIRFLFCSLLFHNFSLIIFITYSKDKFNYSYLYRVMFWTRMVF